MAFFSPLDTLRTLEGEATLLHRISHHKSIISPPNIHILNFSDEKHQRFFFAVPQQKQGLLRQLFSLGGAMQAYVYPLYGVTMATRIKVSPKNVRWCSIFMSPLIPTYVLSPPPLYSSLLPSILPFPSPPFPSPLPSPLPLLSLSSLSLSSLSFSPFLSSPLSSLPLSPLPPTHT